MKKILPIILLLICMTLPVFAETKEASIQKVGLTFEQAYQLMLENNNSLKAFEEQIKSGKAVKDNAFIKGVTKFMKSRAGAGFAVASAIGLSVHPINMYLTKL